jgi:hypothetical protein
MSLSQAAISALTRRVPGRKAWHSSGQCKSVPDRFVPRSTTAWMQEVGQCRSNCRGVRGDYSFPRSAWECRLNRSCGSGRSASLSRCPRSAWEPGENPPRSLFSKEEAGSLVFANPIPICCNTSLPFIHGRSGRSAEDSLPSTLSGTSCVDAYAMYGAKNSRPAGMTSFSLTLRHCL